MASVGRGIAAAMTRDCRSFVAAGRSSKGTRARFVAWVVRFMCLSEQLLFAFIRMSEQHG